MYQELLLSEGGGIICQSSVSPQMGTPCLMIGIGGTGLAALRRVKKEIYQHLEPDDPDASIPQYAKLSFLGIDTDTDDLTVENPDVAELQPNEQWSLNVPNLTRMLSSAETKNDPCLKWLSTGITLTGDKGAGGNRQAGRFCLFKRVGALRAKLDELVKQTMAAAGKPNIQVHIFAGISGGTGSGTFLDICYILREVLGNINSIVCGYFFLADTQLYRKGIRGNTAVENYNKRNGYAALRDLDYCMSLPASGGRFQENYAPGFSVDSNKAPVDLCHLISATTTNGVIKPDGFSYSLHVVSEYVLTYLSNIKATEKEKENDDKGLTLEGFSINVNSSLDTIKPTVGAERNYNIVGASSAELPLTHIATYLASTTYQKMRPSLGRHSSQLVCDDFARRIGCTANGLAAELSSGVTYDIDFDTDPDLHNLKLNEDSQRWNIMPTFLQEPVTECRTTAIGRIKFNYDANIHELETFDAKECAKVNQPTFILRLFNELIRMCQNPKEGPTMAADILHGNGIHDLRAVLKGIEKDIEAKEENFQGNVKLRVKDIQTAAREFNKAIFGKKKKLQEYQDAWAAYTRLQINIELCENVKHLIPVLERLTDGLYRNYFSPFSDMLAQLDQTFEMNISWLNSSEHKRNESFSWRIFEYDAVRAELDSVVLKQQDIQIEHQDFVSYLQDHYKEWATRNTYRTVRCVNSYMVERFQSTLTRTVDNFLLSAYKLSDSSQLPGTIKAKLLNAVISKANPLFWKNPTFHLDDTTTVSNNVLSIPAGSAAIDNAAKELERDTSNLVVRSSTLGDRVSCLRFVSGIPLYAYLGIEELKGPYENSNDPGLHLHERDVNWRQVLPSPVPYSVSAINRVVTDGDKEKAALYDRAVAEHVICPQSKEFPDKYVVRILDNTESLVKDCRAERFYFAGKLNMGELNRAIQTLEMQRTDLLPVTVPEDKSLPLLNNGYRDLEKPEMDTTDRVRKDYFVRFNALQKVAADSLAQLKRIDDTLAAMMRWKGDQDNEEKKVRRYLMLEEMGYLKHNGPAKLAINYTYRGVKLSKQLCDVDSDYRFASEYQAYQSIEAMDARHIAELDAELAKKYKEPQSSWREGLERILSAFTDERINEITAKYYNDANREAIPAFYRSLRAFAQEDIQLLPVADSAQADTSGWRCTVCGVQNSSDDGFCGECGAAKPVATNAEPESWTCKNGHVMPWTKKFCTKCGSAGGKRPDPMPQAAKAWVCPSCGTKNDGGDVFCGECGAERPKT